MEKKITVEECLNALNLVTDFIDQEEGSCSETRWRDKNGLGFSGDMGYLFEGLDALEMYLKARAIIDVDLKIPNKCAECACCNGSHSYCLCAVSGEFILDLNSKPKWCPLMKGVKNQ